jgi:hypothetical protein
MTTNGDKGGFTRGSWDTIGGFVECKSKTICSVYPTKIHDEHIANARLIAAAPDLLEALKELYADYKMLADSGDAGNWKLEDMAVGKQALAAIARAEGEA